MGVHFLTLLTKRWNILLFFILIIIGCTSVQCTVVNTFSSTATDSNVQETGLNPRPWQHSHFVYRPHCKKVNPWIDDAD